MSDKRFFHEYRSRRDSQKIIRNWLDDIVTTISSSNENQLLRFAEIQNDFLVKHEFSIDKLKSLSVEVGLDTTPVYEKQILEANDIYKWKVFDWVLIFSITVIGIFGFFGTVVYLAIRYV